jgi:hypothetical protein
MALLGKGGLAIWNGTTDAAEAEFVRWHVREHIPERVGVPGFLRGRRYVGLDGHPKYFNFYETASLETLESPAYQARLNDPTPWTRRVVSEFRDTIRTPCTVAGSMGLGTGAWIETVRLGAATDAATFRDSLVQTHLPAAMAADGIVATHLLQGVMPSTTGGTVESTLRGAPDSMAAWIILIEAVDAEPLQALRNGPLSNSVLRSCGGADDVERGIYRLQFALSREELLS